MNGRFNGFFEVKQLPLPKNLSIIYTLNPSQCYCSGCRFGIPNYCICDSCSIFNKFPYSSESHKFYYSVPCREKFRKFNQMTLHMAHSFLINHIIEICDLKTFQCVPSLFYRIFEDYSNLVDCDFNTVAKSYFVPRFRFSYVIYKNPDYRLVQIIYNKDYQLRLNDTIGLFLKEIFYRTFVHDYDDFAMNKVTMVVIMIRSTRIGCFLFEGIPKVKMKSVLYI